MTVHASMSALFLLILLWLSFSSPRAVVAARGGPLLFSVPSTARPPVALALHRNSPSFMTMDPSSHNKWHRVFGGRETKSCLPKGFRHTSAPSRFMNHEPLGTLNNCSPVPKDSPFKP